MSTQPEREEPNIGPENPGAEPAADSAFDQVVLPRAKLAMLGNLISSSKRLSSEDLRLFLQEVAPLFKWSVEDEVVANFCEAATPFLSAGAPIATTLKLCADLLEQSPPQDQLSPEIGRAHV